MFLLWLKPVLRKVAYTAFGALGFFGAAHADTISPTSYSGSLAVGESVTVRKTVTIAASGPTAALLDIMFVFDTTGSMGNALAGAKATATSLITSLGSFGSVTSGVGFYNDPGAGLLSNLSPNAAVTQAAINPLTASGGGDYPELGYDGISAAANGANWRAGSNRFVVVLGDAGFKNGAFTRTTTQAALTAVGAKVIGIDFCASSGTCSLTPTFGSEIVALGGKDLASSTSPSDIAAAIIQGITFGFANYTNVTVGDLGTGLPEIATSAVCLTAGIGTCSGASAVGTYDRSVDRTFTYDVTFTRVAAGAKSFDTSALVNGSIVASERDSFNATSVPEPGTLALVAVSLLGVGVSTRRRAA